jgi:hypothetical protein
MTRRRIAWSTAFVATLLGSTGLHLATTAITAQAGVGPDPLPSSPAVQGAALGPTAYPADMSAPSIARLELLPAATTAATTSTAHQPTDASARVLAETRVRQPISLFPAWAYGGVIRPAALPSSAGDAWARAEALLATGTAAAPEIGNRMAQSAEAAAMPFAAELRARQPIALFPAGLYDAATRHVALPDFAAEALARIAGISTEMAAAAPEVASQPVQTTALPVAADLRATQLITLSSFGLREPVAGHSTLPERHPVSPAHAVLPERLAVVGDPSPTEVDTTQMFADARPLAGADLDELRGGVFDVNGWKIAFGVNVDVKLDLDFKISTFLNPVTKRGGFALNVGNNQLVRNEDGSVRTQGNPAISDGPNGRRFDFGDFAANVRETDDGFDLSTDGERPVELSQNPAQVVQVVGSEARTLVRHQLSPSEIIAQLNNIQNNGRANSLATIAIDILNHDERVSISRTLESAEHLNRLIVRDLMGRIGR